MIFEVTQKGFDGSTDATDHLVQWIDAPSLEALGRFILKQNLELHEEPRDISDQDITFLSGLDKKLDEWGEVIAFREHVRCDSGLMGYRTQLRNHYESCEEFERWAETYSLPERLGFATAEEAWEANPVIQGSAEPSDFRLSEDTNAKD